MTPPRYPKCTFRYWIPNPVGEDELPFCRNKLRHSMGLGIECPGDCPNAVRGNEIAHMRTIPSRSGGTDHHVQFDGQSWNCDCPGGLYRGKCWAMTLAKAEYHLAQKENK